MRKAKTTTERPAKAPKPKLNILVDILGSAQGASLDEMVAATGWQKHSVRGAIAGTLKRKGHAVSSEKVNGVRRYRLAASK